MARFNEILVGRYNRLFQKLFSIKGPASLVTMSDELMPVFQVFNGTEHRYLEGWQRFAQAVTQGANAAQNSAIRLRNPVGSNIVAVIEKLFISNQAAAADFPFVQVQAQTADYTTVFPLGGNSRFDPRGQLDPNCVMSHQNAAPGGGGTKLLAALPVNANLDVIITDYQEFPLLPGDALSVQTTTVNQTLNLSLWWRERFLEESERT